MNRHPKQGADPVILICSPYLALTSEPSIWEAGGKAGVRFVELLVDPDLGCPDLRKSGGLTSSIAGRAEAEQVKREAADSGIKIELFAAPLLLSPGMTGPPSWTERLLDSAGAAGARQVSFPLVTKNFMKPEIPDQEYLDSALRLFSSLTESAKASGIKVLFENLSVYLNRPEILGKILDSFSIEDLGFCLDPVNLAWYGHPLSEAYRIAEGLAPRATGLHIKNIKYPPDSLEVQRKPGWRYDELVVPAEKGDLDFSRLIRCFRDRGFNGYYGIEDDSLNLLPCSERLQVLRSNVEFVRALLAPISQGPDTKTDLVNSLPSLP